MSKTTWVVIIVLVVLVIVYTVYTHYKSQAENARNEQIKLAALNAQYAASNNPDKSNIWTIISAVTGIIGKTNKSIA